MRLEVGSIHVHDVAIGRATALADRTLVIDPEELRALVLDDSHFDDVEFHFVPAEQIEVHFGASSGPVFFVPAGQSSLTFGAGAGAGFAIAMQRDTPVALVLSAFPAGQSHFLVALFGLPSPHSYSVAAGAGRDRRDATAVATRNEVDLLRRMTTASWEVVRMSLRRA